MKQRRIKTLLPVLLILFLLVEFTSGSVFPMTFPISFTGANGGTWTKKAPICINNIAGSAQINYPIVLNVSYDSDMNNDFSDLRVKNETSGEFIPYWIESKTNGNWCKLWFNATYVPGNSWCNDTYYLYYGNPSASDVGDGNGIFTFFDDFEDGDVSDWTIQSGGAFEASTAQVKSGSYSGREYSSTDGALSYHTFENQSNDIMIEFDYRPTRIDYHQNRILIGTDGSDDIFLLAASVDKTFRYYDPNKINMRNFDTQWYKIQILAKPSQNKASVWIDGILEIDNDNVNGNISGGINSIGFTQYLDNSEEFIDNIFVRKYSTPEPSAQLCGEQNVSTSECTTPIISSLTNSTPGATSVTITWITNQSTDNRVKYSKNSDLSDYSWSSWDNDTTSVSITLTTLDSNTTYYYQVWSYNGTNSNCYTTEPSSEPYKNFTTISESESSESSHDIITIKEWLSESQVTYELIFILIIVVVSVLVIRAFLFGGITEEEIIIAVKFIILTVIVLIIGVAIIQNLEGLI